MTGVRLIAVTKHGAEVLRNAFHDAKSAPYMQRRAYETMYREAIVSERPFTISITSRVGMSDVVVAAIFESNIAKMGLMKGLDYEVVLDE